MLLKRSLIDEDDEVMCDEIVPFVHLSSLFLPVSFSFSIPSLLSICISLYLLSFFISSLFLTVSLYFFFSLFFDQVRDRAAILLRAFATMTDEADLKCLFDEPMPMYVTPVQ